MSERVTYDGDSVRPYKKLLRRPDDGESLGATRAMAGGKRSGGQEIRAGLGRKQLR